MHSRHPKGWGIGRNKNKGGGSGREGKGCLLKEPPIICSFLRTLALASSGLAEPCWLIYWCVLVRGNHDHDPGIKEMTNVFYWHKLWKIKITPIKLQLHVETWTGTNSTVIACLAGRDVLEVLYTGFVQNTERWLQFLPDICRTDIHKSTGYNYSKNFGSWTCSFSAKA